LRGIPSLSVYMRALDAERKAVFMPYVTAGYPSLGRMRDILSMLRDGGAGCVELGVPFSDPIADGATIQAASQQALAKGMTLNRCLDLAGYAARIGHRVVLMSYMNPLLQSGMRSLNRRLSGAGVQGLIVPDLPLEAAEDLSSKMASCDVALALFAAPTTPSPRLRTIGRMSRGFVYYVSLTGVTGERARLASGLRERVALVRKFTGKPICVGFGVSSVAQAAQVARFATGVIVGSGLVRRLAEWNQNAAKRREIARWTRAMAQAVNSAVRLK
jgi:tryptophan synthase alpha chain